MQKYEYMVHVWGGFYNAAHAAIHRLSPGYFWFDTETERASFVTDLRRISGELDARELCVELYEGTETRSRTVAKLELANEGKTYSIEYDFGYAYPVDSAEFMFTDGNYSCDCNLSAFIREKYQGFPELECGGKIETVKLDIESVPDQLRHRIMVEEGRRLESVAPNITVSPVIGVSQSGEALLGVGFVEAAK